MTNVTDTAASATNKFCVMTDDQITALYHVIEPFSYTAANPAVVRTSDPESIRRQVFDASATGDIARIFADIETAKKRLFVIFALALPIAFALLDTPLWS